MTNLTVIAKKLAECTALNPYRESQATEEFLRSELERLTEQVFKSTMQTAKYEMRHLIVCPSRLDPQIVLQARSRRLYHVLPPLTGDHSVGHASFVIEGPKKTSSEGDSLIGIEIYAPTSNVDKNLRLLESGDNFETLLSTEQLQTLHTHSADSLDSIGKFPILIFSHGLGARPEEYRLLLEELASHGYIVLSLNHPSSSGHASFSKEAIDVNSINYADPKILSLAQAANIRFVIDRIRDGKILKDLELRDQIVLAGHSIGGAASIIVFRKDPLIAG